MIGKMLPHYRLIEKIGEGRMGVVWKAEDLKLRRTVALKILKPEFLADREGRRRFLREAHSAAAVTHPFIASIHDADEADGRLFIVMEYVEGQTLRSLLSKRPLPIRDALRIGTEIAEGLARAHEGHIIHRDLKPGNVMVGSDGHAKILDFGLARLVQTRDEATTDRLSETTTASGELTVPGEILGTPAYMSPEQARGETAESRSDVFSFGSTLYEMVCGTPSFRGPTLQDTVASILRDQPVPASHLNTEVPSELERIISRCLRKDPEERYNDTRDLVAALKDLRRDTESPSLGKAIPVEKRQRPVRTLALALGVVVIALLAWFKPWGSQEIGSSLPNWILVAEFEGPPDDPNLAVAARELVLSSLAQSKIVAPISHSELKRGLKQAMKPDTLRVVGEVARELAYRAAARTYVEGRVDRMLAGYSIVLSVLDAEDGHLVASLNGAAESDEVFISTLDRLGRELREEIGEKTTSVRAARPQVEAMTPIFESYRKYIQARDLSAEMEHSASNRMLGEALKLDPAFARAWSLMGHNFWNLGFHDSAEVAYEEALRRPERMNELERLHLQGMVAVAVRWDLPEALRSFDLLARHGKREVNTRGVVLALLGRNEAALEVYKRVSEQSPFGPSNVILGNQFKALMRLGRHEEARQIAQALKGDTRSRAKLMLALAASEWARTESLATAYKNDPTIGPALRFHAEWALASLEAT